MTAFLSALLELLAPLFSAMYEGAQALVSAYSTQIASATAMLAAGGVAGAAPSADIFALLFAAL